MTTESRPQPMAEVDLSTRSATWRTLATGAATPLPKGLDQAWHTALGLCQRVVPRRTGLLRRATRIVAMEDQWRSLSDAHLRQHLTGLKAIFRLGRAGPAQIDLAFALIREVADRQLGQRPYLVQVAAALALEAGYIAELATGEGKTLAATLPAVTAGWRGRGCHIVTVNDYLARRDAQWMRPVYQFCDVSVAYIENAQRPPERRAAYQADVTFCTNKEVTADFLRDRLALGNSRGLSDILLQQLVGAPGARRSGNLVLRRLERAIVDEADSILIDEAVTPLIISGEAPNAEMVTAYAQATAIAAQLRPGEHYAVDHRYREVNLTPQADDAIAQASAGLGGLWAGHRRAHEMVTQALSARELYLPGRQYVIQDGKVVIVDEFTGRLMPDRTWREGLHQAVEAKEQLVIQPIKETLARISFQRFFRLYPKLSGMTGTATEAWLELWRVYRLPVVVIPTNRPCIRRYAPDRILATTPAKWQAIASEVRQVHASGRPILVGTRSVAASEHLSALLTAAGLAHEVLNAVRHEQEAQVVAGAGLADKITVATNMAGRGTDIKLGPKMAALGGLHVIITERHESGRIDRQLAGRCARQGDPGSVAVYASLEDELVRRYAPWPLRRAQPATAVATAPANPALPPAPNPRLARWIIASAQQRAEGAARAQRSAVLRNDDWLEEFLGFTGEQPW
jgi:preprotein translocase subunit SecA